MEITTVLTVPYATPSVASMRRSVRVLGAGYVFDKVFGVDELDRAGLQRKRNCEAPGQIADATYVYVFPAADIARPGTQAQAIVPPDFELRERSA